tara:strand:- start:90 stop:767 length:678 start_codon:yes stop_codon:yes gene_type:complete
MGEIVLSVNGLKISASEFDTPIVSGNVSLYNQTNEVPINPTPVIGMVGSNSNINKIVSNKFEGKGDIIISIGESIEPHKSPYFLQDQKIVEDINLYNELENINLESEKLTAKILMEISDKNLIQSCNDISRGGIFMTLIKMIQKNYGFNIKSKNDFELFCEYKSGYVLTIKENNLNNVFALLEKNQINYLEIGRIVIEEIKINSINIDYFDITNQYFNNFERIIN